MGKILAVFWLIVAFVYTVAIHAYTLAPVPSLGPVRRWILGVILGIVAAVFVGTVSKVRGDAWRATLVVLPSVLALYLPRYLLQPIVIPYPPDAHLPYLLLGLVLSSFVGVCTYALLYGAECPNGHRNEVSYKQKPLRIPCHQCGKVFIRTDDGHWQEEAFFDQ